MNVKPILGAAVGLQSVALLSHNAKLIPGFKKQKMKGKKFGKIKPVNFNRQPKITPKKLVKTGITNIAGISLLDAQASMINKF